MNDLRKMKKWGLTLFISGAVCSAAAQPVSKNPVVYSAEVDSIIHPASAEYMIELVKKARQTHTLLVFLFHGVGGGHNINVSRGAHGQLLHYLKDNEQNIWIAPMVDVAERIKAYQAKGN